MSENSSQESAQDKSSLSHKEIKQLVWIGIISVWLTMALILYTGTTNYQNTLQVERLSGNQGISALSDEVGKIREENAKINKTLEKLLGDQKAARAERRAQLSSLVGKQEGTTREMKSELLSNLARMNGSLEQLLGNQKAGTEEIKTQLTSETGKMNESLKALFGEQKAVIQEVSGKMDESLKQLLGEQKKAISGDISSTQTQISESIQNLITEQRAIMEDIKSNSFNSEGIKLLKKFIENQTSLLGQLSGTLKEAAGVEAQKEE